MNFISSSTIFYILDSVVLPLGSTILMIFFFVILGRQLKQDQIDIFYNGKFMEPKKAKSYLAQIRKEKMEREFQTLVDYERLFEQHRKEYLKLRDEGVGIKQAIAKVNPPKED